MAADPLSTVRVLDFGSAWAGPYGSELLAFMGAEVIRVESRKRLDPMRERSDAMSGTSSDIESSIMFHDTNMNKMSVTIDLSQSKGMELARRLAAISDIVIENFRPGVMDRLGLGYATLQRLRPDIIMVSVSACGQTGPARHYAGFATIFNALSGLGELTGYRDGPPTEIRGGSDLRVGTTAAFAAMAALHHRLNTGQGQQVDLSAWEALSVLIGDFALGYAMNGRPYSRMGNHDSYMAPHNCYPCQGEDHWVSIAIASDEEWQAFCRAIGEPAWAKDARFADVLGRWHHQDELDRLIARWTASRTPREATDTLQPVGVAAFPVMSSADMFEDPHLEAREFTTMIEHPRMGKRIVVSPPWKLSATPAHVKSPAPMLGQHNGYVFGQLLGVPDRELDAMVADGIVK